MKRGAIATLASLAVLATVGPIGGASAAAVVAQQKQPSQFSDRFLASLEEADANVEEENTNSKALMEVGDDRRRKLSWWSLALMFMHCDPQTHEHCPHPHPHPSGSNAGSTASGSNSNSGARGYDGSGGSYGANGEGYDNQKAEVTPGTLPFGMMVGAAAALVAALAALAVAATRRKKPDYHQLRGSVKQRMTLFSGFANQCFEDRAVSGVQSAASRDGMQVV